MKKNYYIVQLKNNSITFEKVFGRRNGRKKAEYLFLNTIDKIRLNNNDKICIYLLLDKESPKDYTWSNIKSQEKLDFIHNFGYFKNVNFEYFNSNKTYILSIMKEKIND